MSNVNMINTATPKTMMGRIKTTTNPSLDWVGEIFRKLYGSEQKLTSVQRQEFLSCLIDNVVSFLCVLFVAAVLFIASTDSQALTNRYYTYTFFIILPILFGGFRILPIFKRGISPVKFILIILTAVIVIICIYFFLKTMNSRTVIWANYMFGILFVFTVISVMAFFFQIFIKHLKNISGWKGFIIKLLFYIPCLFLDLIEYMINDYNNTPKIVCVIFILQILAIALYIIIPKIYEYYASFSRVVLLKKPMYLNRLAVIGTNDDIKRPEFLNDPNYITFDQVSPNGDAPNEYFKNYSISMWIYVNENETSNIQNKEIPVFKYGNEVLGGAFYGKPLIVYAPSSDNNNFKIYYSDNISNSIPFYMFELPKQKWNYLAINYNSSQADLFINGKLENTCSFSTENSNSTLPIYSKYDQITIGYGNKKDKTNGINGAITDVIYYREPLTKNEVKHYYLLGKDKSIPSQ